MSRLRRGRCPRPQRVLLDLHPGRGRRPGAGADLPPRSDPAGPRPGGLAGGRRIAAALLVDRVGLSSDGQPCPATAAPVPLPAAPGWVVFGWSVACKARASAVSAARCSTTSRLPPPLRAGRSRRRGRAAGADGGEPHVAAVGSGGRPRRRGRGNRLRRLPGAGRRAHPVGLGSPRLRSSRCCSSRPPWARSRRSSPGSPWPTASPSGWRCWASCAPTWVWWRPSSGSRSPWSPRRTPGCWRGEASRFRWRWCWAWWGSPSSGETCRGWRPRGSRSSRPATSRCCASPIGPPACGPGSPSPSA